MPSSPALFTTATGSPWWRCAASRPGFTHSPSCLPRRRPCARQRPERSLQRQEQGPLRSRIRAHLEKIVHQRVADGGGQRETVGSAGLGTENAQHVPLPVDVLDAQSCTTRDTRARSRSGAAAAGGVPAAVSRPGAFRERNGRCCCAMPTRATSPGSDSNRTSASFATTTMPMRAGRRAARPRARGRHCCRACEWATCRSGAAMAATCSSPCTERVERYANAHCGRKSNAS